MAAFRTKVLVVDDDPSARTILRERLKALRFEVLTVGDGQEGLDVIRKEQPSLVLLDLMLPRLSGIDVLRAIRRDGLETTVIVMTAFGTIENAVEAMKEGAYDFITKPFDPKHLEIVLNKVVAWQQLREQNRYLQAEVDERHPLVIGQSPLMKSVVEIAQRAAPTNSTILLLGESGTGKEILARAIHRWSPRQDQAFVVVNCAALPEPLLESELFGHEKGAFTGAHQMKRGKFEIAHGGTILLDEVGDLKPGLQAKLLRVLQEREFERVGGTRTIQTDLRVIAATNKELEQAVREGTFREDLYYRLNVVSITLPPLRERREELPVLVDFFLRKYAAETKRPPLKVAPEAMKVLMDYDWPGNVRELENAIECVVVLSLRQEIRPEDLPTRLSQRRTQKAYRGTDYHTAIKECKAWLIKNALQEARGNQTRAAEMLGIQRTYLAKLIRSLGLREGSSLPGATASPPTDLSADRG